MNQTRAEEWRENCEAFEDDSFPDDNPLKGQDLSGLCQWVIKGWRASDYETMKGYWLDLDTYIQGLQSDLEAYRAQDRTLREQATPES